MEPKLFKIPKRNLQRDLHRKVIRSGQERPNQQNTNMLGLHNPDPKYAAPDRHPRQFKNQLPTPE
jgi:hypothetical protein